MKKSYTELMSDNNYTDILLEDMNAKFDVVLEAVGAMRDEIKTLARQDDLVEVKHDMKIVKAAVTDLSDEVRDHSRQLSQFKS